MKSVRDRLQIWGGGADADVMIFFKSFLYEG